MPTRKRTAPVFWLEDLCGAHSCLSFDLQRQTDNGEHPRLLKAIKLRAPIGVQCRITTETGKRKPIAFTIEDYRSPAHFWAEYHANVRKCLVSFAREQDQ